MFILNNSGKEKEKKKKEEIIEEETLIKSSCWKSWFISLSFTTIIWEFIAKSKNKQKTNNRNLNSQVENQNYLMRCMKESLFLAYILYRLKKYKYYE